MREEGYNEEELKTYLNSKGYSYDGFQVWMEGQTVGVDEDGNSIYWSFDVERYME